MTDTHISIQRLFGPNAQIVEDGGSYYLDIKLSDLGLSPATKLTAEGIFLALMYRWFLYQSQDQYRLMSITRKNPKLNVDFQTTNSVGDPIRYKTDLEDMTVKIYSREGFNPTISPNAV